MSEKFQTEEVNIFGDELKPGRPTTEQIANGARVCGECEIGGIRIVNADGTQIITKQEEVQMANGKTKKVQTVKVVVSQDLIKKARETMRADGRSDSGLDKRSESYIRYLITGKLPATFEEFNEMKSGERNKVTNKMTDIVLLKKILNNKNEAPCTILRAELRIARVTEQAKKEKESGKLVKKDTSKKVTKTTIKKTPKVKAKKTVKPEAEAPITTEKTEPSAPETNSVVPSDDPTINAGARSRRKLSL